MGFFDNITKKLSIPYDDEDDEFIDEEQSSPYKSGRAASKPAAPTQDTGRNPFYDEFESPAPTARGSYDVSSSFGSGAQPYSAGFSAPRDNKVVNIHTTTQLQVVLVKPEKFETAAEIADHLREKRTVVMNLEQTNKDVSRRLIDFLSGVAYAQDGKIKKVAVSTYIITPYNVDIMGDLIDELENNGLYI